MTKRSKILSNAVAVAIAMSLLLVAHPVPAQEAEVIFEPGTTRAIRIDNLQVGTTLYTVTFDELATAESVYGPYPGTYTFTDDSAANDAVDAVNAALTAADATAVGEPGQSSDSHDFAVGFMGFEILGSERVMTVVGASAASQGGDWFREAGSTFGHSYDRDQLDYAVFTNVGGAPDASFTYEPSDPVEGDVVQFTDTSTGEDIDSWEWDFGDGGTSTEQNPSHVFFEEGSYEVQLTVTNSEGDDVVIETVNVSATLEAPLANFTYEPQDPVAGQKVKFTDTSTGGAIESWLWDFDDGETSTRRNPTHTFDEAGSYTVHLQVTNAAGTSDKTEVIDVGGGGGGDLDHGYFIPAASFASGAEGSFFQTDVDVNNRRRLTSTYVFLWLPRDANNSQPTISSQFQLPAGASVRHENVLGEVFGLEPNVNGALAVASDSNDLVIMTRTYNVPTAKTAGTFGQAIIGVPVGDMIESGEVRRITFGTQDSDFRTNIGCVNGKDERVDIDIDLFDETGNLLVKWTMDLGPWSNKQINKIFNDYAPTNGYADVYAVQDGASFYCYGSVLDNQTSDPITVPPQ